MSDIFFDVYLLASRIRLQVFDRYKSKIEGKRWGKTCVLQLYKGVFWCFVLSLLLSQTHKVLIISLLERSKQPVGSNSSYSNYFFCISIILYLYIYYTPIRDKIAISCMLRQIHEFSSHAIRHGLYIKNRKRLFCL